MARRQTLLVALFLVASVGRSDGLDASHFSGYWLSKTGGYSGTWGFEDFTSKVNMAINSGCPFTDCSFKNGSVRITLANITVADSPVQQYEHHWMWGVIGHPVIQAAVTSPDDVLTIDWNAVFGFGSISEAVKYKQAPVYSSAIMITKLIEFGDAGDTGTVPGNGEAVRAYDLIHCNWNQSLVENSTRRVAIEFVCQNYSHDGHIVEGKINLTLSAYSVDGFGRWLPHLSHSRKTNQFDVQLDGLRTNSGFNSSRFAIELVWASDRDDERGLELVWQKTTILDDEHTPGIFSTEELIVPGANGTLQSYMQWRPIVYTTNKRDLSSSTGLYISEPKRIEDAATAFNNTMLYALYGADLDGIVVRAVNVSFGSKGDGFYNKTHYQAWTFTFGTGAPIRNGFSGLIFLAIGILSAVSFLTIAVTFAFLVVKRVKARRQANYRSLSAGGTST